MFVSGGGRYFLPSGKVGVGDCAVTKHYFVEKKNFNDRVFVLGTTASFILCMCSTC